MNLGTWTWTWTCTWTSHTHKHTHTHTPTHTHARTDTFPEPEPTSSTKAGTKCPRDTHIDTQTHTDTLPTHAQKVGVGAWGDKAGATAPTPSLPVQTKVLPVRFDWRHYPKNRRKRDKAGLYSSTTRKCGGAPCWEARGRFGTVPFVLSG